MNKGLNLKSIDFRSLALKYSSRYGKHMGFAAAILVLLVYVVVVMKISSLSKAEPNPSQTVDAKSLVPHVNQQAIDRIQALENNSPQIHSLFEQARNNPFQE
jgi:hypothetical protein